MYDTSIEKERKRDKKIASVIKRAMILFGCGFGFIILTLIVPDITDKDKMNAMKHLFYLCGIGLIIYGGITLLPCILLRNTALLIDGIMTWFIAPSFAIWFGYEVFKVLNQ